MIWGEYRGVGVFSINSKYQLNRKFKLVYKFTPQVGKIEVLIRVENYARQLISVLPFIS